MNRIGGDMRSLVKQKSSLVACAIFLLSLQYVFRMIDWLIFGV